MLPYEGCRALSGGGDLGRAARLPILTSRTARAFCRPVSVWPFRRGG